MPTAPGSQIGPYEIISALGAGGMGEVFRARDTRLGREVALKVLPEAFAADESRRGRFSQEARAAGSLNHPGIVAVYDIGFEEGLSYIVTELVEGSTLRALLSDDRPSQRKSIDLAVQIAEALAAAHSAGITHRDLKPENIMVSGPGSTQPGRTKILDFGLAKQATAVHSGATQTEVLTQDGVVVGTIGYMSPEQVRGKQVDARSDIFSFGLILYEMLAGVKAFQRDTMADTMSAILREDLPELPATVSPGVAQIVRRCLEKEPSQRFQSAADLAFALRALSSGSTTVVPVVSERAVTKWNWVPYAVAALGLLAGGAGWWLRGGRELPLYQFTPLTSFTGVEDQPSLSTDGKQLAFAWRGEPPDATGVYVKLVAGGTQALRISPAGKASQYPTWSPDGTRVAYVRRNAPNTEILVAPALGGPERRIAQYAGPASSIAWSPDGKWIAVSAVDNPSGLKRSLAMLSVETGELHRLTQAPKAEQDVSPRFSPDGTAVAFIRTAGTFSGRPFRISLGTGGAPSGEPQPIGSRRWYVYTVDWFPDGKSVLIPVIAGATFQYWKIPTGGGAPIRLPLEFPIDVTVTGPTISLRGSRLAVTMITAQNDIGRLEWNERTKRFQPAEFYNSSRTDEEVQMSPDQQWVVFSSTRSGNREIWRAKPDGSQALLLTSIPDHRVGSPRWSADNRWIAFDTNHEGHTQIYAVSADGGKARPVTTDVSNHARPSFSGDGKWVYFAATAYLGVGRIPFAGGTMERVTTHGYEAFESPDGRWVYHYTGGKIFRLPVGGGAEQSVLNDSRAAAWALAGTHVYLGMEARGGDSAHILRLDPESGRKEEIYRFPPEARRFGFATSLAVSRDERTIYHTGVKRNESDIMLVDNVR